jgi:hypothetical protein
VSVRRPNQVDPFGDLHAISTRGLFTGNRGCLVNDERRFVRHHQVSRFITCVLEYGGRKVGLDTPRRWTPIFLMDDAVALAAGHRPCGECRRADYRSYRDAVSVGVESARTLSANDLDNRLVAERFRPGRGFDRAADRRLWAAPLASLPDGAVVIHRGQPHLVIGSEVQPFAFAGWGSPVERASIGSTVDVLTPPTSVTALRNGFRPTIAL